MKTRKKSLINLAGQSQSVADKLKNFWEDSRSNHAASRHVDYNKIDELIIHLEEVNNILIQEHIDKKL